MEQKSYTRKELRAFMEATGYPMASIEKTMRLLELLKAINADTLLGENLTLKGGTAINIIHYSEIPRLSVDLDSQRRFYRSRRRIFRPFWAPVE